MERRRIFYRASSFYSPAAARRRIIGKRIINNSALFIGESWRDASGKQFPTRVRDDISDFGAFRFSLCAGRDEFGRGLSG